MTAGNKRCSRQCQVCMELLQLQSALQLNLQKLTVLKS